MSIFNTHRQSWFEATARKRIQAFVDAASFVEFLPPEQSTPSIHLAPLELPGAFDDGAIVGKAFLDGKNILIAAQEGQFMGGAVGEKHGAKMVGLLKKALVEKPAAVIFMIDSGGVRLQEANAGLIAISEIIRALLDTQAAGVPVIGLIGGTCGAFGGMGIVACLCSTIIMSEQGRLGLSGPEVIETVKGVEEFDSKDRALVWRVTGGKHRYLMDDAEYLVDDDIAAFRNAAINAINTISTHSAPTLAQLEEQQNLLELRLHTFEKCNDGLDVWEKLGVTSPQSVSILDTEQTHRIKEGLSI